MEAAKALRPFASTGRTVPAREGQASGEEPAKLGKYLLRFLDEREVSGAADDGEPGAGNQPRDRFGRRGRDELILLAADDEGACAPARQVGSRVRPKRHAAQRVGDALRRRAAREHADAFDEGRSGRDRALREWRRHYLGTDRKRRARLLLALFPGLRRVGARLRAEKGRAFHPLGEQAPECHHRVSAHRAADQRRGRRTQRVERGREQTRQIVHRAGTAERRSATKTRTIDGSHSPPERGALRHQRVPAVAVEREGMREQRGPSGTPLGAQPRRTPLETERNLFHRQPPATTTAPRYMSMPQAKRTCPDFGDLSRTSTGLSSGSMCFTASPWTTTESAQVSFTF